jgi:hypothetical protein
MKPRNLLQTAVGALLLLASAALLPATARAQQAATGQISGHVYNPVTQEYVRNAEVRIQGTSLTDYTENDG